MRKAIDFIPIKKQKVLLINEKPFKKYYHVFKLGIFLKPNHEMSPETSSG